MGRSIEATAAFEVSQIGDLFCRLGGYISDESTATTATRRKTKRARGARKRLRILGLAFAALLIWAGFTAWSQMERIAERKAQLETLQDKLEASQRENEESKREIERLNDPEYLQERARKDLQYVKPGETVFDVPKADTP